MPHFWNKLARFHEKHHWLIILVVSILTYFSFLQVKKLKIDTNLAALLPQDYRSVQNLNQVIDKLGGLGDFTILVENESLETKKEFVREAAKIIEENPAMRYVDYEYQKSYFQDHLLLYIDLKDLKIIRKRLKEKIKYEKRAANPFFVNIFGQKVDLDFSDLEKKYERRFGVKKGFKKRENSESYFLNPDNSAIAFIVKPKGSESNIGSAKKLYAYLQDITSKLNKEKFQNKLAVEIAGPFRYKVDEYNTIVQDVKSTAIFTIVGVILLLIIAYRQFVAVFFILIPLVMGIGWTFAAVAPFIGFELNLVTAFLFIILFGLGVDFGIHMLSRYLEFRYQGMSIQECIVNALSKTGMACFTSAITTVAAFYSLLITDFKGFSEMGLIAGTGVWVTLLSIYAVFPSLLIVAEKFKLIRKRNIPIHKWQRKPFPFSKPILICGIIITVLSIFAIPRLELEYDFTNLRANLKETLPIREKIGTIFTRSQSPAVVIADNYEEALAVVNMVEDKIEQDTESPTIDSVLSIPSILPPDQDEKLEEINKLKKLLEDKALKQIEDPTVRDHLEDFRKAAEIKEKVDYEKVPANLIRQFEGVDGSQGYFVYIFPSVQLRDGREALKFAQDIREIVTPQKTFYPSSDALVFADMLTVMIKDGKKAIIISLLAVFLFLLIDFRSFRKSLLVMSPLICSLVTLCGFMFICGMKLNFFNIIAIPSLVGIGIDNGVHVFHRYVEEGKSSLLFVIRQTGQALFLTTFTTMNGYGGLLIAYHPGLKSLGNVAVLGFFICYTLSLTLFPALLQMLEDRKN